MRPGPNRWQQLKAQQDLIKRKDKYGNQWGTDHWPMNDAYCSYLNCSYTEVVKIAFPGQKCPKCGRPLSWAGIRKGAIDKKTGKREVIYNEPKGKWKP